MTEPVRITTHKEDAISRFIEQYKNSENLKRVIEISCKQKQDIEDALWSLFGRLDIEKMTGILLDKIGVIVGQERLGFNDSIYRILLYTRIAINMSGGTPENIISIFQILTQAGETDFRELYPAAVQITSDTEPETGLLEYIKKAIETALPAGVKLSFIGYYNPETAFTLDNGLGTFDNVHGLGDVNNPAIGGELGKVL